ncbi:hypothetical protein PR048_012076 [Dryococelus australis]|uniref:Reverse transcriptase domain-containing protein n=1 Tax=Dryococelus australis TaxID=614101 RepID=A0ABQ9HNB7_9NEOP|nr:hypothetical protein PR048_012076 [Dryococelus australis]
MENEIHKWDAASHSNPSTAVNHLNNIITNSITGAVKQGKLVSKPLVEIINVILTNGSYPDALKIAKIIPIHKTGDKKLLNNYRPIYVLNFLNKICEQMIHEILAGDIFVDLRKAFDLVNHEILLIKLERYGIRGTALNLLKSYLTNSIQLVQIRDHKSNQLPLKTVVPQGSVLSPLLFLIYINDIGNLPLKGSSNLCKVYWALSRPTFEMEYTYQHTCQQNSPSSGSSQESKWSPHIIVYDTFINSHFQYLNAIWGSASKSILHPLQLLQNKALKIICNLPYQTKEIFTITGLLPLKIIHEVNRCWWCVRVPPESRWGTGTDHVPGVTFGVENDC